MMKYLLKTTHFKIEEHGNFTLTVPVPTVALVPYLELGNK